MIAPACMMRLYLRSWINARHLCLNPSVQGDMYFPDTLAVGQILSETYFPADGQTGATLSLTMNLQCQAQYALAADVRLSLPAWPWMRTSRTALSPSQAQ